MTITFRSGDIIVHRTVQSLTVGLGRKFVLSLGDIRPGSKIRWMTENDPVLDLRESEDKQTAKVKATGLGNSVIEIINGLDSRRVTVKVVPMNDTTGEAVTLNGSIGEEVPDEQN